MVSSSAIVTYPCSLTSTSITPISSTLVVIDPKVADYQILASGVLPGVNVVILNGDREGVEQITAVLQQNPDITNLHLVAHGASGVIYLGNKPLNLDTIDRYSKELQSWAVDSLFIYGCQVAAGDAGEEFLHKLHHLTGAAIAASITKTGNAILGGNWRLEVAIGDLQYESVFTQFMQQEYGGILGLLNADDYAALKALYQNTDGANWTDNTGWKDWDFNSTTPPDTSVVNTWKGIYTWNGRVIDLTLRSNNLNGTIPAELGNLSDVIFIILSGNRLSGTIPTSLGNLRGLRRLELQENQLTGSIPPELGNAISLSYIVLSSNRLSGTIPSWMGSLQFLENLYLEGNNLSGDIPQSIVDIFNNRPGFDNLDNPPFVTSIDNQTTLPDQPLTLNVSISDIDQNSNDTNLLLSVTSDNPTLIDSNGISVTGSGSDRTIIITPISGKLGTATITMTLQDSGSEQTVKTFNLTVDTTLNADDYAALKALYQGTDGANWTENTGWKDWDFNSTTPPASGLVSQWKGVSLTGDRVADLSLGNNNLVGSIPAEIGNFASLTNLNLINNQLSGSIPAQIGNLTNLTDLYLYGNKLSGSIPSQIGNLTKLSTLNLDANKLSGSIPIEVGNLSQLSNFSAYDNQLSGSIPTQIGNLTNLVSLSLNENQLSGSIPSEIGSLPNLSSLDLSGNQLSGNISQAVIDQLGTSIANYNLDNVPFLAAIANQLIPKDKSLTFNLSISDIDRGSNEDVNNLTLTVTSNNSSVLDSSGISVTGTGSDRTILLTPKSGQIGSTTITMTLQDQSGEQTVKTFTLNVEQTLNASDYAALKALYQNTGGANWTNNIGWKDWDFGSSTPPILSVVSQWKGVSLTGDRVTKLSLSVNKLKGNIPTELGNLSQLNTLDLALNQLSGTIPSELGNLDKLTKLFLNGNQLGGEIPTTLLSKLGNPIIYRNLDNVPYLSSVNDQSIVQDQALTLNLSISDIEVSSNDTNLSLSFSSDNTALIDTSNISITGTGSDRTVTLTPISGKSGSATITMTLQNSSGEQTLKTFVLTVEPTLNGDDYAALKALYQDTDGANWANNTGWRDWDFNSTTPPALSVASQWYGVGVGNDRVQTLSLINNNLSGVLPIELGDLSNLIQLNLPSNHLIGTIPAELGNLNNLAVLDLQSNQLSGAIPAELGNLNNLSRLFLNDNQLSGDIPTAIANKLKPFPPPLGIIEFNLDNAPFVTSIADQFTTLNNPVTLDVSISDIDRKSNDTNLTLGVTSNNTALIDSSDISVTGAGSDRTILLTPISGQLGSTTITMTLQDQNGEQTVKTFTLNVEQTLNANDYAALKALYQNTGGANWTNNTGWKDWNFSSSTPPILSVVSQWKGVSLDGDRVTALDLYNNNLSGSIPTELGNLTSLTALRLYENQLSGSIPSSLGNLSNLAFLNLADNQLSGSVPSTLGNLSNLVRLNLFTNQLSGSIPSELGNLNKLSLFNLSYNQLSGSIPSELGNLNGLTQFYLNDNQLSGTVPQALVNNLGSLTGYDLNNAPFVTSIANRTTTSDKPLTLALSVSDIDTSGNADPTVLTLKAVSNNSALIGESGISISGTGGDRILTLTPTTGQTGTATITLTLQDDSGEKTEKTLTLTVNASSVSTTPGTGTTTPGTGTTTPTTDPTPGTGTTTPAVTLISSITSLFDATKGEFVVSDALLSLNEETLPSGDLFRLRNGTSKADKLRGTGVNEAMFGKAHNDQMKGSGGNDCLSGGKGNDTLNGDAGNDLIFGDAGNDTLVGGAGNDILIGGTGSDRIIAGAGSDQVAFAKPIGGKNIDTITDFNAKTDHIVVLARGFGGGLVAGQALSATQFQTGTKAIGSDNRFIYNRKTGDLFFDADGSGAGKAIAFASFKPGLHLSSQNITVV